MNQQQLKYAKERAHRIYTQKQQELTAKFSTPAIKLSREERIKALKDGKFKVLENGSAQYYLTDYISFDEERIRKFDGDGFTKALAPVTAAYDKLLDELILGDNEEALKLLRAFEAF